jgi:hypothetical protein
MTTSLVAPNESHSPLIGRPSAKFETWKQEGADLVRSFEDNKNAVETDQWAIGDWLLDGETKFGEKAYAEAEQITGWVRGHLYNVVWVTRRFPTPSLRSETGLKWSHFKELARIEDENVRIELLQSFNDGFPHSVLKVRSQVDAVLEKMSKPNSPKDPKTTKSFVYMRVSLKPNVRNLIQRLAKEERKTPEVFLRNVVQQYLEREEKLDALDVQQRNNPRGSKAGKRRQ